MIRDILLKYGKPAIRVGVWVLVGTAWAAGLERTPLHAAGSLNGHLKQRIERLQAQSRFACQGELLCGIADMPLFYQRRDYRPAWIDDDQFSEIAASLIETIAQVDQEGLRPDDYHLQPLQTLLAKVWQNQILGRSTDPEILVDLDLLLTDAFLLLGSHLLAGRVNPQTIHAEWLVSNPTIDMAQKLQQALENRRIRSVLERLKPAHSGYRHLKKTLREYRTVARNGGWPLISADQSWRPGEHGSRFLVLRKRLMMSGDLPPDSAGFGYLYDDALVAAVRSFQHRHGLILSGIVDGDTLTALNVSVERRIRQILINLERWRWIPRDLGRRYILVNIADFHLAVVEDDRIVQRMRVVVGRNYRKTPVFSERLTYLEMHPHWNIPTSIAVQDILPKIKKDPYYLDRQKIKVFHGWDADALEIDPQSVDWSRIHRRNFSFRLRQEPGPLNALGRIKFMLPNQFSVYLHDTPTPSLFEKRQRGFSSGCIRLEHPIDLAAYLLKDQPGWSREAIHAALDSGRPQVIRLTESIPVHLLYWTAWSDRQGRVHFRTDIYGRDGPLSAALEEKLPRA